MKRATLTRNVASVLILALTFALAGCGSSDTNSPGENAARTKLPGAELSKAYKADGKDADERKRESLGITNSRATAPTEPGTLPAATLDSLTPTPVKPVDPKSPDTQWVANGPAVSGTPSPSPKKLQSEQINGLVPSHYAPAPVVTGKPTSSKVRLLGGVAGEEAARPADGGFHTETYDHTIENQFRRVMDEALSTFSIDVDTASYSNVRRILTSGQLPPAGAVRIEEMINYFDYAYAGPAKDSKHPFAAHVEIASCPWAPKHRLARIGIRGKSIESENRPPCNLVFLLDVSGSMRSAKKLPLVKKAMTMLTEKLNSKDRVAIVVYAGAAGLVLDSTSATDETAIKNALNKLQAGGSTNGGAGITLAYKLAVDNKIKGGINRVILCTDGDFNIGNTSRSGLVGLVKKQTRNGVYLTVLGFGMGNYKDSMMEEISNKGNGTAAYIDSEAEAKKVLVKEINSTLMTIAKDVKIQVEFNPAKVAAYRLIGYENRMLKKEDFNDDKKDAGEIGAGHTVTALYELVPAGMDIPTPGVDKLKYQSTATAKDVVAAVAKASNATLTPAKASNETLTLKLRYKQPEGTVSTKIEIPVTDGKKTMSTVSPDFQFATAVAAFGMILRDSKFSGTYTLAAAEELAAGSKGPDANGYRAEFVKLVQAAKKLKPAATAAK